MTPLLRFVLFMDMRVPHNDLASTGVQAHSAQMHGVDVFSDAACAERRRPNCMRASTLGTSFV